MASTARPTIVGCLRDYPHTKAIKSGQMDVPGVDLDFVEVKPHIAAFRRMVRDLEFDFAELAPTTYIVARTHGAPFVALPIFFTRRFHHAGLVVRPDSGIATPKDLEGKKVGVRAYTVTTGVWTRGVLANEYGVDLDKVTWVVDDEEHVEQLQLPPNVIQAPNGKSLAQMIQTGELDAGFVANAGIGRQGPPAEGWNAQSVEDQIELHELIPDSATAEKEWFDRTGIYPMHSTLVVKSEVLDAHPGLAEDLYRTFLEAKNSYLADLELGRATGGTVEKDRRMAAIVGGDPLPYGIEDNRSSIEALIKYAHQQRLIPQAMKPEDIFVPM